MRKSEGMEKRYLASNKLVFVCIILMYTNEFFQLFNIPLYLLPMMVGFLSLIIESIRHRRTLSFNHNPLFAFGLLWLVYGFLLLLIKNPVNGLAFYRSVVLDVLVIVLIALTATDQKVCFFYLKAACIGQLVTVLVSIYEFFTKSHIVSLSYDYIRIYGDKAFGFQVNINDNACALFLGLFAVLLVCSKKFTLWKWLCVAVNLTVLFFIGSRTTILAVLVCLLVVIHVSFTKLIIKRKAVLYLANVIMLIIYALVIVSLLSNVGLLPFLERIFGAENFSSDMSRLDTMQGSIQVVMQHYLLGAGPGGATLALGLNPHNLYLEMLADYGFFMLVFLGVITLAPMKILKTDAPFSVKLIILSFVFGFIAFSIASSSTLRIRAAWILLAVIYQLYRCYAKDAVPKSVPVRQSRYIK